MKTKAKKNEQRAKAFEKAIKAKSDLDDTDELYRAVQRYIENRGGKIVVIGGIEIIEMPEDRQYTYHFSVRITGSKPRKDNHENDSD